MLRVHKGLGLLWLGLLGCAVAPPIPRAQLSGWHAVAGGGFRLLGDVPAPDLAAAASELEIFQRAFAELAQRPATGGGPAVPIFLIRNQQLARRFGLAGMAAGWMLPTLEGCLATVEVRPNRVENRRTLFHEYTHVLLRRNRRAPLPPWYDEGLSTYFSTLGVRDGAVIVGSAPGYLIAWLDGRGAFPLDRLFGSAVWTLRPKEIGDFYATGWALSHLLLGTPRGRQELSRFAAQLERGAGWEEAYASTFDRPVEQLEAQLESHVALLSRGAAAEAVIGAAGDSAPGTAVPLQPAEIAYELGRLALALHREAESRSTGALARKLLEVSLAEAPAASRTRAALAEARALHGDLPSALALARGAVELAPDDAAVRVHAGRVELARAESIGEGEAAAAPALGAAEAHFRRALDRDPASAVAWAGLGQTWRRAGRSDEAMAAFERARSLGWSGGLDLELGGLYLELGRRGDAVALLLPLAQDAHRGRSSEQARELLEQAGLLPGQGTGTP